MPPAKRIILMYITEISGHHSATLALEKALRSRCSDLEILNINAFNYTNPISEKIINRLYMIVIQTFPQIWDFLYDNPNVLKGVTKIKEAIHKFNSPKLKKLFKDFKPDVVACTQAFPCGMVADYKRHFDSPIRLVAVLTDYVPHSYWIYDTVDYYIAPSDDVAERLVKKNVVREKIKTLGIPFDSKFNQPVRKEEAIKKLGLDPGLPIILIMGGGHGLGPINTIIKSLENIKQGFQQIIVTGSNAKLYKSLMKEAGAFKKKTIIFGYAGNIHELMDISTLIITKPGGITTAEALTKNMPIVIVNPIPGQEANNTAFLTARNAAIKVDDPTQIDKVIGELLQNPQELNKLRRAAAAISKPNASTDIADFILSL